MKKNRTAMITLSFAAAVLMLAGAAPADAQVSQNAVAAWVPLCACPITSNVIIGTNSAENLDGTAGKDCIIALGGGDTINAKADDDRVCAGGGGDTVHGDSGNDVMLGEGGGDSLTGDTGNDTANGGNGTDFCDAETETSCEL